VSKGVSPPVPPPAPTRTEAVRERQVRALEEPLDLRLRTRQPFPLLEVRNPIHRTVYLVMLPEFPGSSGALCTCTDFARRGLGTCKHIEAGVRWLAEHPDATPLDARLPRPVSRRWRRIDAAIAQATRDGGADARRVRRAGAVLLEPNEK
jgi:hypothetical protein